jgi:hypothetical protein
MQNENRYVGVSFRFITGFALGFDLTPVKGVYVTIYLGIIEIAIYNEEAEDE